MRRFAAGLQGFMLMFAAMPALADDGGGAPVEFHSNVYESGEAWLVVNNRGDEPVTLRQFRWSDSPRTGPLELSLEPHQQSSVALTRAGKPPLWISLADGSWVSEAGGREAAPEMPEPTEPSTGGFVPADEPSVAPPAPVATPEPAAAPAPAPVPMMPPVAVKPAPAVVSAGAWSVVLNSFASPERARADAQAVSKLGYAAQVVESDTSRGRLFRVLVPYASRAEAEAGLQALRQRGRRTAWLAQP